MMIRDINCLYFVYGIFDGGCVVYIFALNAYPTAQLVFTDGKLHWLTNFEDDIVLASGNRYCLMYQSRDRREPCERLRSNEISRARLPAPDLPDQLRYSP
jgi:hypothetical protein